MRHDEVYSLKVGGVSVDLAVADSGVASDEVLGDAVYRFEGDLARLLAPMRLAVYNGLGVCVERTLGECAEDATGEAFDPEVDDVLALSVDAGIGAVSILLDRGEPFAYSVDLDTSRDGPFWAFHDLSHAVDDCAGDWESGLADFPPVESWAEDRANLEGARRALRAGVDLDDVLGALTRAREPFAERFGEQSTAVDDLLDGGLDFLPDDVREGFPTPEAILGEVEACAARVLDDYPEHDLDDLDEVAREEGESEGLAHSHPGAVVVALRDFDDLADAYGPGEVPDLDDRAAYAFGGATCAAVRRLAECEACGHDRKAPGLETCADCADDE